MTVVALVLFSQVLAEDTMRNASLLRRLNRLALLRISKRRSSKRRRQSLDYSREMSNKRRSQVTKFVSKSNDKICDWVSRAIPISYGVPQGCILGLTVLLIHINDICQLNLQNTSIFTYADNTDLIFCGGSGEEAFTAAQAGFNFITTWLKKKTFNFKC